MSSFVDIDQGSAQKERGEGGEGFVGWEIKKFTLL